MQPLPGIVFGLVVVVVSVSYVVVIVGVCDMVDESVFSHKILFVISQMAFSQRPSPPLLYSIKTQGLGSR